MSQQLFPEAIRLMRARHKLDNFIGQIICREPNDVTGKKYLKDLVEELRLIELELYKTNKS